MLQLETCYLKVFAHRSFKRHTKKRIHSVRRSFSSTPSPAILYREVKWRWSFFNVLQFLLCVHAGTMVSKLSSIYHVLFHCRLVIDFDKMELPYMFSLESWFKHADFNTRCPVKNSTWCGCLMMFDQLASSSVYIIKWLDLYYESLGNPVRVLQKNVYIYII